MLPEKVQIEFKWHLKNFRLDIPLENIQKIEVNVSRCVVPNGGAEDDFLGE